MAKVTLVRFGFFFATQNVNQQRKYFLEFGAISELEVQADKGQAFITFDDHDSVDRAVSKKHTVSKLYFTIIFVSGFHRLQLGEIPFSISYGSGSQRTRTL